MKHDGKQRKMLLTKVNLLSPTAALLTNAATNLIRCPNGNKLSLSQIHFQIDYASEHNRVHLGHLSCSTLFPQEMMVSSGYRKGKTLFLLCLLYTQNPSAKQTSIALVTNPPEVFIILMNRIADK